MFALWPARQAGGHWFEPSTAHFRLFRRECGSPLRERDPASGRGSQVSGRIVASVP